MLGVLQRPLVAISTALVNASFAEYSVRNTAAPTPSGTENTTAPSTSQKVPAMAGATPLTVSSPSVWPVMVNGQWNQTPGASRMTYSSRTGMWNQTTGSVNSPNLTFCVSGPQPFFRT